MPTLEYALTFRWANATGTGIAKRNMRKDVVGSCVVPGIGHCEQGPARTTATSERNKIVQDSRPPRKGKYKQAQIQGWQNRAGVIIFGACMWSAIT